VSIYVGKRVRLGRPRTHIVYPRAYDWPSKGVGGTIGKLNKGARGREAKRVKATESNGNRTTWKLPATRTYAASTNQWRAPPLRRPAGRPPSLYKQTKISLHSHTPTGDCASKASTQVEETSTPPVLQTFQPICRARYHRRPWPPPRDPAPSAASPPPTRWRPRTRSASCACNASAGQPRAASTPSPRRRTTSCPPPARPAHTQAAAAPAPSTLPKVTDRVQKLDQFIRLLCRCN
jgi:hypothetical protein